MPLPVQSLSKHVDPRWRRCVCGTGSLSSCPAPAPTLLPSCSKDRYLTWIQDGGCVYGTGSLSNCPAPAPTLHPSCSSPLPVRHHRSDSRPEMEKNKNFLYFLIFWKCFGYGSDGSVISWPPGSGSGPAILNYRSGF
jgi:hypothetical protein